MKISSNKITLKLLLASILFINPIYSDSFKYNYYNNHGVVGLINTPSARFYNEEVHGVTIYDGTPDQKVTLSSNPYNWLEASFFYTNIQNKPYPGFEYQDYKDKGFNIKIRVKNTCPVLHVSSEPGPLSFYISSCSYKSLFESLF